MTLQTFLDDLPPLQLPADLRQYWEQKAVRAEQLADLQQQSAGAVGEALENIEAFYQQRAATLQAYLTWRQSAEWQRSPAGRLQQAWRDYLQSSGYYTVFIPALRSLSPAYEHYCQKLQATNQAFLSAHPEFSALGTG
ncbi:hypothetical protein HCH52_06240 [Oscillospiraceae bacterium HV4-5-C5C]|nr:hypothetical protein [Oscillospiraceae bacterium HV4-5-C5C]